MRQVRPRCWLPHIPNTSTCQENTCLFTKTPELRIFTPEYAILAPKYAILTPKCDFLIESYIKCEILMKKHMFCMNTSSIYAKANIWAARTASSVLGMGLRGVEGPYMGLWGNGPSQCRGRHIKWPGEALESLWAYIARIGIWPAQAGVQFQRVHSKVQSSILMTKVQSPKSSIQSSKFNFKIRSSI